MLLAWVPPTASCATVIALAGRCKTLVDHLHAPFQPARRGQECGLKARTSDENEFCSVLLVIGGVRLERSPSVKNRATDISPPARRAAGFSLESADPSDIVGHRSPNVVFSV